MKSNHQLFECISDEEWDQFIQASPQCNVFSLSPFIKALNVDYCRYLFSVDDSVLASILIVKPGDHLFSAPHPFTLYQGLAYSDTALVGPSKISSNLRTTQSLLQHLNQLYPCHSLCLHPSVNDMRAFQWYNYHQDNNKYSIDLAYTGIVNLSEHLTFSNYLSSIRSSRRQEYKKSKKFGISLSCENRITDFIRIYELTFSRQNIQISSPDIKRVAHLVLSLLKSGIAKMFSAIDENGYVCSSVVIISDSICDYYLFGATDPDFRSYGLNTFLLLESIRDSFESGKKCFDMVGINSPNRGDYKTSFNSIPSHFFTVKISNDLD